MATRAQGLAAQAAGDFPTAVELLEQAILIARERNALSTEEMMLCSLADAQRQNGDPAQARATAGEAVELSIARGNENYELMGHLALLRAMLADERPGDDRAMAASIARCDEVITANGVALYRPELDAVIDATGLR